MNMNKYIINYTGNATRFEGMNEIVLSNSKREAVEAIYSDLLDENYFPNDDLSIQDCSGKIIADADDDQIEYDGGYFVATLID
jgi:hypothetical protein